jgi:hypothetical protein
MGECLLWQWFGNYGSSAHLWATFFHGASYVLILTKNAWGKSWATFSQTHLVTLVPIDMSSG